MIACNVALLDLHLTPSLQTFCIYLPVFFFFQNRKLKVHMMLTPCFCSACEHVLLLLFVPVRCGCHMPDCLVGSVSDSGHSYEK